MKTEDFAKGTAGLAIAVVLTILLFNIPYGRLILYPFSILSTWFHEMGHGMTAWALGADFNALVLRPDTSGFALYSTSADFGALRRGAIASAGYLGTAVIGCALLSLRRWPGLVRGLLGGLAVTLLLSGFLVILRWPDNTLGRDFAFWLPFFGFAVVSAWAAGLGWVVLRGGATVQHLLFNFIAAQTALNAVLNIRVLFLTAEHSDAVTMQEIFVVPAGAWAALWLVTAVALAALGLYLGVPPKTAPTSAEALSGSASP